MAGIGSSAVILECAILNVKAGQERRFEETMAQARPLIAASPGFMGIDVRPCVEQKGRYLLQVRWEALEDHTQGFRSSKRYQIWSGLLHEFYDPFPTVEHYGPSILG